MRYIADSSGYLLEVSFGAEITCDDQSCVEYTGSVPTDYASLEAWYVAECEKLYRWKIVSGDLTLDSSATAPTDNFVTPVEKGGTGAADAATALTNLGGVAIDLLWTNDNPTTAMGSTTIDLDLSEYQLILLYARTSTDYAHLNSASAIVGKYSRVSGVWGNNNNVFHRAFTPTETGITFEGAYYNSSYNTSYLIPMYVYGVKNVQGDSTSSGGDTGESGDSGGSGDTGGTGGGSVNVDLSDYVLKTELESELEAYATTEAMNTALSKKVNDYTIDLYNGTGGNPKGVKCVTVNYSNCTSETGVLIKIGMVSGRGNGTSYTFLQDAILKVDLNGNVEVDNFKYYGAATPTYDGEVRQYGDIFWVVDTTNKVVDFYCLMGQYSHMYQTPLKRLNQSTGGTITQHTSCTVYSSGTKVWANNSDIALMSDVDALAEKVNAITLESLGGAASSHTHSAATTSSAGFMSASDKSKLDGIAAGANAYSLPTATSSTLGGVKIGSNITASSGTISVSKDNVVAALGYTPPTTNTTYSFSANNPTLAWDTTSKIGTAGGTTYQVKMPSNPNTWRGIQNNLTSTSTTDSLSAYQGKVLNDSKLSLSGGTMTGEITIGQGDGKGIQLGTDGRINATASSGSTTATLLGVVSGNAVLGHSSFNAQLRGAGTRPTYNGSNMALTSDIPDVSGKASLSAANTYNGEQIFQNDSYAPTAQDNAYGVGCAYKASRGAVNQEIVGQIIMPISTVSDDYGCDNTANTIKFQKITATNSGVPSLSTVMTLTDSYLDVPGLKINGSSVNPDGSIDGVGIDLLWTNSSPTSAFGAQTVSLDLSSYQMVLVMARVSTDYSGIFSNINTVGTTGWLAGGWGSLNNVFHREYTVSTTGIYFYGGYYKTSYNTSYVVPYQIYGIRGVS